MSKRKTKAKRPSKRYGAAELYGRAVVALSAEELRRLSAVSHKQVPCPFKDGGLTCHKKGGVCSLGLYERKPDQSIEILGKPVTTCPARFLEQEKVFRWVGKELLGVDETRIVKEVSFLMANSKDQTEKEEVGRIDNVLVSEDGDRLKWCALEMQAVYFSGGAMGSDFKLMRAWNGPGLPFPTKQRRPDFRSSGPKRLMPQLQIKVPTLRRWGKKMAVVIDRSFWDSLGPMNRVSDISNADIVWFVVSYDGPSNEQYHLNSHDTYYTTLEDAVTGLTGGTPVSLGQFESLIKEKLERGEAK